MPKELPHIYNEISERKSMTAVFPVVFVAIALLTILTTMSRLVKNQIPQIGVLKALGFRKNKIMLHYLNIVQFLFMQ